MPCRYFEPLEIAETPFHRNARLPLIDEYDGKCHANCEPALISDADRFSGCNHGNRGHDCGRYPATSESAVNRFTVIQQKAEALEILAIEEANHTPNRWYTVQFVVEVEQFTPDISDICQRAQLLAFCRSYLKRAVGMQNNRTE